MGVIEVYQATWERRYLNLIQATLSMLRRVVQPSGALPVFIYTGLGEDGSEVWGQGLDNRTDYPGGMLFHVLYDIYRLFRYKWICDWIVKLADSWIP